MPSDDQAQGTPPAQVAALQRDVANLQRIIGQLQTRQTAVERLIGLLGIEYEPNELPDECLHIVMDAVGVESGSLIVHEPAENVLRFAAARGPYGEQVKNFTLQPGQGIAGWCFAQNEPVAVSDVEHDERFSRDISEAVGYAVRSLLAAPLRAGARVIGVLELINKTDSNQFLHADIELAVTASRVIGLILQTDRRLASRS